MSLAVAVDIGGTFTDLVAFDHDSKKVVYAKSPTTYGNFVAGILNCFDHAGLSPGDASLVHHGTTLVINSLIQRDLDRGYITAAAAERDYGVIIDADGKVTRE